MYLPVEPGRLIGGRKIEDALYIEFYKFERIDLTPLLNFSKLLEKSDLESGAVPEGGDWGDRPS